ncbi:MAG: DUF3109 family protein [Rikenellaceae bacterium]|nr:DUF3109 family protein [Rikenellaceae bacterium]
MVEIEDKIVSTDIFDIRFCCDLAACKGICCVEGNAGAPLEAEEIDQLEEEFDRYKPYLKPEGVRAIERQGFFVVDDDGDLTTPLIDGGECAYVCEKDGVTFCAIEKAWHEGKTPFRKPISCHLYPIRLSQFSNGTTGIMYHRWSICADALRLGKKVGQPLYRILREPLVRRFSEEFFRTLEEVEATLAETPRE